MALGFQRKSLDEILAGAPGREGRTVPVSPEGGPTPLWAVIGEAAPFGWEPDALSLLAADATRPGEPREPAAPKTCGEHYPPGSVIGGICEEFSDSDWANCVRACLYKVVPEEWRKHIRYGSKDFLRWAAAHFGCWAGCVNEDKGD
jgi:hypothetical protein